jgi:hypothetical protein
MLESYESRLHRYAMLGEADKMTGSTAYYCALHAEYGAARALAFVLKGRR